MSSNKLEIVLVLDLFEDPFPLDTALGALQTQPLERLIVHSNQVGAPRLAFDVQVPPACWDAWARSIQELVIRVRKVADGREFHLVVTGNARLPIFVALGRLMERRIAPKQTFVNVPKHGPVQVFVLRDQDEAEGTAFMTERSGLDLPRPQQSSGTVALQVWSRVAIEESSAAEYVERQSTALAGVISVGTHAPLEPMHVAPVVRELETVLADAHRLYPRRRDVTVFIAGPAPLAFIIGQMLSPQVFPEIDIPNHWQRRYERALRLPLRTARVDTSFVTDADRLQHLQVLHDMMAGVKALCGDLKRLDVNTESGQRLAIGTLRQRLDALALPSGPVEGAFDLRDAEGRLEVGRSLLHALRLLPTAERSRFGQMLLLHELFHVDQKLFSTNYTGVGRAGVALEEIDIRADMYAIEVIVRVELDRGGPRALDGLGAFVESCVNSLLIGIEAFDRSEQGESLDRLYERRLRRYLHWHLLASCAPTLRVIEDLGRFVNRRVFVELAPLKSHLDERFDKIVEGTIDDTELFVVCESELIREPDQQRLRMASLLEAVRKFRRDDVRRAMDFVRDQHRRVLVPWVGG